MLDLSETTCWPRCASSATPGGRPKRCHLWLTLAWYWSLLNSTSEPITWLRFVIEVNAGRDLPELVYAEAGLAMAGSRLSPRMICRSSC